jgi:hypothetical protein
MFAAVALLALPMAQRILMLVVGSGIMGRGFGGEHSFRDQTAKFLYPCHCQLRTRGGRVRGEDI